MLLQITAIQLDFTCEDSEDYVSEEYKEAVTDAVVGQLWEVDDEEDLVDEVTSAYGWCVVFIDYRNCLTTW